MPKTATIPNPEVPVLVPDLKKRCSLKLSPETHTWWAQEVERIKNAESLNQLSITALLRRIASADLDLTHQSILEYVNHARKRARKKPSVL